MDRQSFQFNQCLSINFGYHDDQLSIPQVSMTPDSKTKLTFDSPSSCIFVVIGGKYLKMIGKVMEKVNSVTKDVGRLSNSVFLINVLTTCNNNKIFIYCLDKSKVYRAVR